MLNVRVEGQLIFNSSTPRLRATLAGFGLAFLPADMVQESIGDGRLVRMPEDWCQPFPGYHIYDASLRQASPALPGHRCVAVRRPRLITGTLFLLKSDQLDRRVEPAAQTQAIESGDDGTDKPRNHQHLHDQWHFDPGAVHEIDADPA